MDNIELFISGNLTGFSRFYASSGANDIFKDTKIDLDCRNFVTFVEEKDKAYSISFSPQVIILSLITRILDSFHRPGILVVSLLLPRNTKVVSENNPQNEKAVYQLLNTINDKFYEKNYQNGMLNQNPIVLKQDYYSEILANYRLEQDRQSGVNLTIDNSVINKNAGYVKSSEINVAAYLATPCRRSYEGYHSIFISPKAPQNIEEPVEELKLYSVYVENTNKRLYNVTIDSKIEKVSPESGELDIPNQVKNLTYRQVLEGQGTPYINAIENGDSIHLIYHFKEEEKLVTFKIKDENREINFEDVTLKVQNADGTSFTISNNPFIFRGKEIYDKKTLVSGDNTYVFSIDLDLSRIPNKGEFTVKVSTPSILPSYNSNFDNSDSSTVNISNFSSANNIIDHNQTEEKRKENIEKNPVKIVKDPIFSKGDNENKEKKENKEKRTNAGKDIRKALMCLVGLWVVLGGIYIALEHFNKKPEEKYKEIPNQSIFKKNFSFYIEDTAENKNVYLLKNKIEEFRKNHIEFEISAFVRNEQIDGKWNFDDGNDTILYTINKDGYSTDSLAVKLIVKYNGKDIILDEISKKIPFSDSSDVKSSIILPVAFRDLKFYDETNKKSYKEDCNLGRIQKIHKKSETLYNKLMEVYNSKYNKSKTESSGGSKNRNNNKLTSNDALKYAKKMKPIINTDDYQLTQDDINNISKWNDKISEANKYNREDKQKKYEAFKNRVQNASDLAELASIKF